MSKRAKVLVTDNCIPKIAFDLLERVCDIVMCKEKDDALIKAKGVDAIFWGTHIKLDKDILDAAGPQLKVVSTMSAGYNHIDTSELKRRGIKLGNTANVLDGSVADMAVLLAVAASRRLHEGRLHIERGTWEKHSQWMLGQDISYSTIGIVGLGGIGQTIAKRLNGFDVCRILYTGHKEKPEGKQLGAIFVKLDELLKESDFVFISCPLTDETREMCNDEFFTKMKESAVFVNISRGDLVNQNALISALKTGKICAAGLDVMTPEPLPTDHELLKISNLVLSPHLGSATRRTRDGMAKLAAENLLKGLSGEKMPCPVNL